MQHVRTSARRAEPTPRAVTRSRSFRLQEKKHIGDLTMWVQVRVGTANGANDRKVRKGFFNYTAKNAHENHLVSLLYPPRLTCSVSSWNERFQERTLAFYAQSVPRRAGTIASDSHCELSSKISALETHHTSHLLTLHITIYTRRWEEKIQNTKSSQKKNQNKTKNLSAGSNDNKATPSLLIQQSDFILSLTQQKCLPRSVFSINILMHIDVKQC